MKKSLFFVLISSALCLTSCKFFFPVIPVKEVVELSESTFQLSKDESFTLSATIKNSSAQSITWSTSIDGIVSLVPNGLNATITAVSYGNCLITATTPNGAYANMTVSVLSTASGGWVITPQGKDPDSHEISCLEEFNKVFGVAACKHYSSFDCTFNFDNSANLSYLNSYFVDFNVHCYLDTGKTSEYHTGINQTSTFYITYRNYSNQIASKTTSIDPSKHYEEMPSANSLIRKYRFKDKMREPLFEDFPINKSNLGTLDIYNSEELWFAVANNYLPNFTSNSLKAKEIYEYALNICRSVISDQMTDLEKYQTLYEWIVYNTNYNYEVLDIDGSWYHYKSYFLEGVFETNSSVCDGYSKFYALLCGIENLPVVRAFGYDDEDSGHAWNYVKIDSTWYLACPTWGQMDLSADRSGEFKKNITMINYEAFLTHWGFFETRDYHPDQKCYPSKKENTTQYIDITLEKIDSQYDFFIDKGGELNEVFKIAKEAGVSGDFSITLKENVKDSLTGQKVKTAAIGAGISCSYAGHISSTIDSGYITFAIKS